MDDAEIRRAVAAALTIAISTSTLLLPAASARAGQSSDPRPAVETVATAARPTTGTALGTAWQSDSTPFPHPVFVFAM